MENLPSRAKTSLRVIFRSIAQPFLGFTTGAIFFFVLCACSHTSDVPDERELILSKLRLVKLHLDGAKAGEAWETIQPLLKSHENNPDVLNFAGLTMLAMSNPKRAIYYFRKAYEVNPSTPVALNISSALVAAGDHKAAKVVLENIVKKGLVGYPFKERVWHNIALVHEKEGNNQLAIKYYNRALDENPNFYITILNMGKLYKKTKQLPTAVSYLRKAQKACPSCLEPISELANHWLQSNNPKLAIKMLRGYVGQKELTEDKKKQARALLQLAEKMNKLKTARQ